MACGELSAPFKKFLSFARVHIPWFIWRVAYTLLVMQAFALPQQPCLCRVHVLCWSVVHGTGVSLLSVILDPLPRVGSTADANCCNFAQFPLTGDPFQLEKGKKSKALSLFWSHRFLLYSLAHLKVASSLLPTTSHYLYAAWTQHCDATKHAIAELRI